MEIVLRLDALESGLKRYFSGVACRYGHVEERLVSNGRCMACDRQVKNANRLLDPDAKRKMGRASYARNAEKLREVAREYRAKNSDTIKAKDKARRVLNSGAVSERDRRYNRENRAKIRERRLKYEAENRHILRACEAMRRARKRNAVPAWFSELDEFVWREALDLMRLRREATGIDWAADHMIPLAAKNACGLHVAMNCQVIPAYLNNRKHNKLIMTEPFDWISHR